MSSAALTQERIQSVKEHREVLQASLNEAQDELTKTSKALEEAKMHRRHLIEQDSRKFKVTSGASQRRAFISNYLRRSKRSVIAQRHANASQHIVDTALEERQQEKRNQELQEMKKAYLRERRERPSAIKVQVTDAREIVGAALRGEWTGSPPKSRLSPAALNSRKQQAGAKPLDQIPMRYPHALFKK